MTAALIRLDSGGHVRADHVAVVERRPAGLEGCRLVMSSGYIVTAPKDEVDDVAKLIVVALTPGLWAAE